MTLPSIDVADFPARVGAQVVKPSRRLRIAMLVTEFPALSETFVLDQAVSLIEMGHDVRIVATCPRRDGVVHEEVTSYGIIDMTRYLNVPNTRLKRLALVARAARLHGLAMISALARFGWARLWNGEPGEMSTLAACTLVLAAARKPDVCLCHFGPNGAATVRALKALGWRVPVATFFHGYDMAPLVRERQSRHYEHLFETGALFLPACEFFVDRLREVGCPADRIVVQRMCVNAGKMDGLVASLAAPSPNSEAFTFAMVGRLVPKKGTIYALRAFAAAFRSSATGDVRMLIIGEGPCRAELETAAQALGVADRVDFLGAVPRRDVLTCLRRSHALVQSSINAADGDLEASPVVVSEAMALCKPVIGTRHSGIPELVVDGETGCLVGERDEDGLAAAMAWMVANRHDAVRMGEAGRRRFEGALTAERWNSILEQRLTNMVSDDVSRA